MTTTTRPHRVYRSRTLYVVLIWVARNGWWCSDGVGAAAAARTVPAGDLGRAARGRSPAAVAVWRGGDGAGPQLLRSGRRRLLAASLADGGRDPERGGGFLEHSGESAARQAKTDRLDARGPGADVGAAGGRRTEGVERGGCAQPRGRRSAAGEPGSATVQTDRHRRAEPHPGLAGDARASPLALDAASSGVGDGRRRAMAARSPTRCKRGCGASARS